MLLNANKYDYTLNADADLERSAGSLFLFPYYLTDPSGNYLTDPAGNKLVGYFYDTIYPQILNSMRDDFTLNTE